MDTGDSGRTNAVSHTACKALITPKATLIATAILWPAAVLLFALHLDHALSLGLLGIGLWCFWLLALGCVGFWTTFLRVTSPLLAEDWRIGVAFGDLNHLPVTESTYEALLADDKPPNPFVRGALWPIFTWIGGMCWGIAALLTGAAASGLIHAPTTDILVALVIIMIPAVQCTAAAVNGPPLTRQWQLRNAAALAHLRMRAMAQQVADARALNTSVPDTMADTAEIPGATLHVVHGSGVNGRSHSWHTAGES